MLLSKCKHCYLLDPITEYIVLHIYKEVVPGSRQTTEPEDTQVPCGGPTVTQLFGHHIKYQQQKSFVFFFKLL